MTAISLATSTEPTENRFNLLISDILKNLIALVQEEMEVLDHGKQDVLQELATKKMRLLTQLQSVSKGAHLEQVSAGNRFEINKLKGFLVNNVQMLDLRIKAINELAGTIENAVRENESDGTYNAGHFATNYE